MVVTLAIYIILRCPRLNRPYDWCFTQKIPAKTLMYDFKMSVKNAPETVFAPKNRAKNPKIKE